jgi:hypothetical protein
LDCTILQLKLQFQYHVLEKRLLQQCLPYKVNFSVLRKTLFFRFKTNFNTSGACPPLGKLMIESQSKQLIYCSYRCRSPIIFTTLWWATIRSWTTCTCHNFYIVLWRAQLMFLKRLMCKIVFLSVSCKG